jgi:hypothetical protein
VPWADPLACSGLPALPLGFLLGLGPGTWPCAAPSAWRLGPRRGLPWPLALPTVPCPPSALLSHSLRLHVCAPPLPWPGPHSASPGFPVTGAPGLQVPSRALSPGGCFSHAQVWRWRPGGSPGRRENRGSQQSPGSRGCASHVKWLLAVSVSVSVSTCWQVPQDPRRLRPKALPPATRVPAPRAHGSPDPASSAGGRGRATEGHCGAMSSARA